MTNFQSRICFGFAPAMLFPKSFEDPYQHFAAIQTCCHNTPYESFETFLPEDESMRKLCIQSMQKNEIKLHYNAPGIFQIDGEFIHVVKIQNIEKRFKPCKKTYLLCSRGRISYYCICCMSRQGH